MTELERLREKLARAKDNMKWVEMSDDYCYTNGVRDGYVAVIRDIERQIAALEKETTNEQ